MPVVVEGIPELKRALKKFAPDLRKEMDAEIRVALKEVTDAAKAKVPGNAPGGLYNWDDKNSIEASSRTSKSRGFPKYDSSQIKRGLTYSLGATRRNRYGFSGLYSLFNKSAPGAIVEVAGRVNPLGRPQMGNHGSKSTQKFGRSNNPDAGRRFVGAMNGVGPLKQYDKYDRGRGRLLYAAYAENQGKAVDATFKAIDKASKAFMARAKGRKAA
jgi:hypothetical protein